MFPRVRSIRDVVRWRRLSGWAARVRGWISRVRRGRLWRGAAVVGAGLAGGWLGLVLGGQVLTPIGPADVDLSMRPSWNGETVVNVAPLGTLQFDTHSAPLRMKANVAEIRLDAAERMFQNPDDISRISEQVGSDLRDGVIRLFVRSGVTAVLGAAGGALLVFRDRRRAGWSAVTALVTFASASGMAAATFNPSSIAEPRYSGLLAGAPQVVGSVEDAVSRFSEYQEQLAGLMGNVSQLYEATSTLPVYEDDSSTIRVLHVSDIHLNPAAWNVIGSLQEEFQADFVVDTGDLTDRGSTAEDTFAEEISGIDAPYVWVRGRQDSQGTQRAVAAQDNAVVLDGEVREVGGLTLYGAGDPRFAPDRTRDNPSAEEVARIGAEQARSIAGAEPPVDVSVLHDQVQGRAFSGEVPLVLAGSEHQRSTEVADTGTRFFVQGSTGGAGLSGLEQDSDEPTPYEASVLYFDAETKRLQAWDNVTLGGVGLTSAQIERHIAENPDREITPASPPPVTPSSPSPPSSPPDATSGEASRPPS
ncbi:calcineurin-like phosphoesterase family protein [Haloactinospora alba]|uniref:Calcineurin-like phosphoesterase family protein n=1 Tax=Haloactinospora alba TaxID=405555 RepID=A0A543NN92_9ACTN|nr:calcineurin-like phosphoesterase family protein [Haloactinospora alba]